MVGGGGGGVVVGGGGRLSAQGQINGAREGGYKRALIKKPSRARCPFFPEGQKVMGEKKRRGVKGWGKRYLQICLRFLGSCVVAGSQILPEHVPNTIARSAPECSSTSVRGFNRRDKGRRDDPPYFGL